MSNERKESLTTKLASTPTGRRSFLRNSGIAALMAAGAMTVQPGGAAAQTKGAVASATEGGEIPEGARITKRMMRSLTLYNLGFMGGSDKDRAAIKEIALGELKTQFSQLGSIDGSWVGYTPNPDDDDPWPWPWWWGRGKFGDLGNVIKWGEIPFDAQLTVRLFDALTVYNQSFLRQNSDQQRKLQGVALGQIKQLVGKLGSAGGGYASWEDGDLCPPWWPWPWPPRRHYGDPEPEPNLGATLDIANSIIDFHLGGAFSDGVGWSDLQRTAFDQMNQQFEQLRGGAQAMRGSFAMWEPGDDICPPWWPWPWPGPRRISEILDPDPHPWRARLDSLKTTVGIFRSLTLVASASAFQDARAGAALQGVAIGQVGAQLEQLGKQIG
ncbi:MAG TPA: hypothetical protein VD886_20480 [Herpetosiphonaceae bacterium]|nr:hypothetical protein [Herpetosiphonaceae bacterium]